MYRTVILFLVLALLIGACAAPTPALTPLPSATPTATSYPPSPTPTTTPVPTPTDTLTPTPTSTATSTPTETSTPTPEPTFTPTGTPTGTPTPTQVVVKRKLSIAERMLKESVQKVTVGGVDFYLHPSLVNLPIERGVPIIGIYKDEQFKQKYGISANDLVREAVLYGMYRGWQNAEDGKYLSERGKVSFEQYKRRLKQGEDLAFPFWVFTPDVKSIREPNKRVMIGPDTKVKIVLADISSRWGPIHSAWYDEDSKTLTFIVDGVENVRLSDKEITRKVISRVVWSNILSCLWVTTTSENYQKKGSHATQRDYAISQDMLDKYINNAPWKLDPPVKAQFDIGDFEAWWKRR